MAELRTAAEHISLSDVVLNRENMTVELRDPEMALDVGGIGKGYTAEIIANELTSDGVSSFVINLGGNLKVIGEKSSGQGWFTGVLHPTGIGYIETFEVKDTAVVTSGDYQYQRY